MRSCEWILFQTPFWAFQVSSCIKYCATVKWSTVILQYSTSISRSWDSGSSVNSVNDVNTAASWGFEMWLSSCYVFECHVRILDSTWCSTETQKFAYSAFRWNTQIDQEIFQNRSKKFQKLTAECHVVIPNLIYLVFYRLKTVEHFRW